MNQSDFSCIKQVTKTVHLTMPLKYTSNEIAGVTEILDGWKRQFVPKLQGVVVNYRNIRLTPRPIFIHVSKTAPRYDVTATFDLFCPSIGDIVKGKINRTSREHIGCLIEGTINATIHLPYSSTRELSKFIRINHDILFQINRFEFNRQTIRVNGQITPECIKLMEELFPCIDDVPDKVSNGFQNSSLNFDKDNSSSDSSGDESDVKSEPTDENHTSNSKSKLSSNSTFNNSYESTLQPIKQEIYSENDECDSLSTSVNKINSKKRKRDSESPTQSSQKASKKRKKQKESKLGNETLSDDSQLLVSNRSKKKKKRREKTTVSNDGLNPIDFEAKFAAMESYDADVLQKIKREVVSPTNLTVSITENENKGKKRKRESSISDICEKSKISKDAKKKKKKSKNEKKEKKKSKDEKKSKSSKMKHSLVASGDILKKDKSKSKKDKNKELSSSKKKKMKRDGKEDKSMGVPVSIKSESN